MSYGNYDFLTKVKLLALVALMMDEEEEERRLKKAAKAKTSKKHFPISMPKVTYTPSTHKETAKTYLNPFTNLNIPKNISHGSSTLHTGNETAKAHMESSTHMHRDEFNLYTPIPSTSKETAKARENQSTAILKNISTSFVSSAPRTHVNPSTDIRKNTWCALESVERTGKEVTKVTHPSVDIRKNINTSYATFTSCTGKVITNKEYMGPSTFMCNTSVSRDGKNIAKEYIYSSSSAHKDKFTKLHMKLQKETDKQYVHYSLRIRHDTANSSLCLRKKMKELFADSLRFYKETDKYQTYLRNESAKLRAAATLRIRNTAEKFMKEFSSRMHSKITKISTEFSRWRTQTVNRLYEYNYLRLRSDVRNSSSRLHSESSKLYETLSSILHKKVEKLNSCRDRKEGIEPNVRVNNSNVQLEECLDFGMVFNDD